MYSKDQYYEYPSAHRQYEYKAAHRRAIAYPFRVWGLSFFVTPMFVSLFSLGDSEFGLFDIVSYIGIFLLLLFLSLPSAIIYLFVYFLIAGKMGKFQVRILSAITGIAAIYLESLLFSDTGILFPLLKMMFLAVLPAFLLLSLLFNPEEK